MIAAAGRRGIRVTLVMAVAVTLAACGGSSTPSGTTTPPGSNTTPTFGQVVKPLKIDFSKVHSCNVIPKAALESFYGRALPVQKTFKSPLEPLAPGMIEICIRSDKDGEDAKGAGVAVAESSGGFDVSLYYEAGHANVSSEVGYPAAYNPDANLVAVLIDPKHLVITVYAPKDKARAIALAKFALGYIV